MNKKPLYYFLLILITASCSWDLAEFKKELEGDLDSDKGEHLIKDFEFDGDIQEKFASKKVAKEIKKKKKVESKKKKVTKSESKVKNKKKEVSKTVEKKPIDTKTEVPKETTEKKEEEKTKKANGLVYPADFPDELIKLDTENLKFHKKMKMIAPIDEKTYIDISYLGVTVGKIILSAKKDTDIAGKPVHHLFAKLVSAPFYKYIYKLDDVVESFVSKKTLLPIKYSLVQRESGQSIDDLQLFDRENFMTYFREKRVKKGKTRYKKKDVYIPYYAQDGLSSLFYLRAIPAEIGKTFNFPLVTKGRVTILTIKVEKREKIKTEMGEYKAILFKMKTRYTGDVVKKGDLKFWLTDDDRRIVLRFEATTGMGGVKGETVDYENK